MASFVVGLGLVLAACAVKGPTTTAAAPNYQAAAPSIAPPTNLSAICYNDADLGTYRVRNVQQQLSPARARTTSAD